MVSTGLLETVKDITGKHEMSTGPMLISLCGGGGKTTILYRLIQEASTSFTESIPMIGTTTTMMYTPSPGDSPFSRVEPISRDAGLPLGTEYPIFVYDHLDVSRTKVHGLTTDSVDRLKDRLDRGFIICESDGAHRLPIKAPNSEEPLHPRSADCVIGVIGLSSYLSPCDAVHIHRFERFSKICDPSIGLIDESVYAELIEHPAGLFKDCPEGAARIVVLNQADSLETSEIVRIASYLGSHKISADAVLITSAEPEMIIYHTISKHTKKRL